MKFSICYEIVTHESAENGEAAEHGWLTADGILEIPLQDDEGYHQDTLDLAKAGHFERKGTLVDALREIRDFGLRWNGSWFESVDSIVDYENGQFKTHSLHVHNARAAEAIRYAINGDLKIV